MHVPTAGGKDDIVSLAKQFAEAQAEMILSVPRGGKDAKRAKETLAYVVEQMMFRLLIEIKS